MASSPAPVRGKKGVSIPVIGPEDVGFREFEDSLNARIALRAYHLYEESGRRQGQDVPNWMRAKAEMISEIPDVQESGGWISVSVPMRDIPPSAISISLRNNGALLCGESVESPDGSVSPHAPHNILYFSAKWPGAVDPATASAYLKDGIVTLTAKQASPADLAENTLDSEERVGGRPTN